MLLAEAKTRKKTSFDVEKIRWFQWTKIEKGESIIIKFTKKNGTLKIFVHPHPNN